MKRKQSPFFRYIIEKQALNFVNSFFKIYAGKTRKMFFNFSKYIMRKQAASKSFLVF